MRFDAPIWFVAVAAIALGALVLGIFRQSGLVVRPSILFSNVAALLRQRKTWRHWASRSLAVLRLLTLLVLVLALARPQRGRSDSVVLSEGIDIMMIVDTSGSMAAEDFGDDRTRIWHATEVMREFAESREADRIGLISFGANAYTRCPMTLDHGLLGQFFKQVLKDWERAYDSSTRKRAMGDRGVRFTPDEEDLQATAIGDAIVAAVSRLQNSKSETRIAVLLTDGESNAGETAPRAAADLAKQFGIKIYAVGAGSNRAVPVTVYDRLGRKAKTVQRFPLDEETLQAIAERTGGQYFRAQDRDSLETVYGEIDRLERSALETKDYREWDERFQPFAWAALALLLLEAALAMTVLRTIP